MQFFRNKRNRKIALIVVSVLAVLVIACGAYLGDYYHADSAAIEAFAPAGEIEMTVLGDGTLVLEPETATAGLIFYPGGKVEHTAYLPLMKAVASEGVLCVLVEMPFRLAVLDVNAADGIRELYPQVDRWYLGGHSLGGSMAAAYAAKHPDAFAGLILLGAYSTADLTETGLDVLSIYGSEDRVMNREKYAEYKPNLPEAFTELVIDGGCHAYFGMYGPQDGDGSPEITVEEQITVTADAILALMDET